ncbi:unnamed protein product [Phytomonas sp. Hart1]|nr:unnamed protein product [Phytomonas sp. Hart1]|eukprot:CCW71509.1 unnamed protein product [Phytomonas sp. isolate Hart1]
MNSKFDPLFQERIVSLDSSSIPHGESTAIESGAWDAAQMAKLSNGTSSVPLPGATGSLDVPSAPADTQLKWDDICESAGSTTDTQKPSPADFQGSPYTTRLTTPPTNDIKKQSINPVLKALQEQIAKRTMLIDAATKEKMTKIIAASKEYIEEQKSKRERQIAEAKELHKKTQDDDEKNNEDLKKSDAVWTGVGKVVDLQKPNPYSKNTERMRSILSTLNQPDKVISK